MPIEVNINANATQIAQSPTQSPLFDAAAALQFLQNFFIGTTHDIELRAFAEGRKGAKQVFSRDHGVLKKFIADRISMRENVYFGLCTRQGNSGAKNNCRELVALWADVDLKSAREAFGRISSFSPCPSIVVSSGGGFHVYWLLDAPVDAHDRRVEPILKGIAATIGADATCAERARVLRVPGTKNFKKNYEVPRDVAVVQAAWTQRYKLIDFLNYTQVSSNGNGNCWAANAAGDHSIPDGQRNTALTSLAGTLRARNFSEHEILEHLQLINQRRCQPPLAERELATIAQSIGRKRAPTTEETIHPDIVGAEGMKLPDMPEEVLDGRLGEICQTRLKDFPVAFSWLSVLAGASALIRPEDSPLRANLYAGLVGPVHCGKSAAIERANYQLDVKPPILEQLKAGSAEGLLAKIGDQKGRAVLLHPDELSHLLEKAQITNASFAYILNSLFYKDADALTIAHGKQVTFNCRLSLIGCVIDEKFDDSFGSATTGGLYDRFLFGQCPTGFRYLWRPIEGAPALAGQFHEPRVNPDVWDARDDIVKSEGMNPRLLEISLRTAFICAAVDGRDELCAADLGPAWALARYQTRVRGLLQPNAGKNFEARVAIKLLNYLNRYAPDGRYMVLRHVLKRTRAYDYGPSVVERALNSMRFGGAIEETTELVGHGQKRRLIRLAGECQ